MAVPDFQTFMLPMLRLASDGNTHSMVDGRELAEFMLDYNLGVTVKEVYEVKRVDSDYFAEE
jgi:restriction endonuclease Mrr